MNTITIPRTEYKKLKRHSDAYLKIAAEITEAEGEFLYDYAYIDKLTKRARDDYKKGRGIEASSIDDALTTFRKK